MRKVKPTNLLCFALERSLCRKLTVMPSSAAVSRVSWVDAAKGLCILLVVLMHATLGVEKATGETTALNGFIEWARPFRMPDFFLISGLFLAARISRPWPQYLDTKVVHFAYFYVLWLSIQFALKAYGMVQAEGLQATGQAFLTGLVQPWGTLWFIYMLAVFFVVAKVTEGLPKALVWTAAALGYLFIPHTGLLVADEFAARFVFFYTGYWAAPLIFRFAAWISERPGALVVSVLAAWGMANWALVANGMAFVKGADLIVSYAGVGAVIAFSVLVSGHVLGRGLSVLGRQSIVIYLAFPLFMGPARIAALKFEPLMPAWGAALISTVAGVLGALVLARLVRGTRFDFLFERPAFWRLRTTPKATAAFKDRIAKISRRAEVSLRTAAQPGALPSTTDFNAARPCS